jgi:hypothetical protein
MIDIGKYADLASALFAFGAAALWIASARVKTPQSFSVNVITVHTGDAEIPGTEIVGEGFGTSNELNDLGKALIKQSRFSAFAAWSAAIAAALQGFLAILADQISN